jgi:hypothetical protein
MDLHREYVDLKIRALLLWKGAVPCMAPCLVKVSHHRVTLAISVLRNSSSGGLCPWVLLSSVQTCDQMHFFIDA